MKKRYKLSAPTTIFINGCEHPYTTDVCAWIADTWETGLSTLTALYKAAAFKKSNTSFAVRTIGRQTYIVGRADKLAIALLSRRELTSFVYAVDDLVDQLSAPQNVQHNDAVRGGAATGTGAEARA